MTRSPFSRQILNIGFLGALVLAALAFVMAGIYLLRFADSTQNVVAQMMTAGQSGAQISDVNLELLQNGLAIHAYVARVLLVSCGMFIALAFGFLGFALFLVGASGQSDLEAQDGATGTRLALTNLAPGTVAIVAATILAALCATRSLPVDIGFGERTGQAPPDRVSSRDLIRPDRQGAARTPAPPAAAPDPLSRPDPNLPR